ncbi:MAG: SH3 domain-containing protein [Chloroflexi bacterium]|nr:SH3 domain-containing protein [Chloroflexota bacterium]
MFLRSFWTKNKTSDYPCASYRLGVEQEFDLLGGDRYLDFRRLFPRVIAHMRSVPFRNCDSAVILDAGYMLACDGREAEFATAPIDSHGDGCLTLAREAVHCRTHLVNLLAQNNIQQVRGYSTHLNISVPIGREWEIASAFSTTIAPALILLMEARQSPGLLIRPRRGRLEIGSEYIDDETQLAAAIILLTGAVRSYLHDPSLWKQFPRVCLKKWEDANIRPGIYLPHDAYGESMHELGRTARLQLQSGKIIAAGKILESCAELALRALNGQISQSAARSLQRVVRRVGSLQIEQKRNPSIIRNRRAQTSALDAKTLNMLASTQRDVTPVFVDWEGVAFSWKGKDAPLILGIPWRGLPQFFEVAHKKEFPQFVASLGPAEAKLTSLDQLQSPRAYASVDPVALGIQALTDKGMHASTKGSVEKQNPKHFDYMNFSEAVATQSSRENGTLAQTMIARRPTTDFAQTMIARRPTAYTNVSQPSSAAASQAYASSQGSTSKVGWIIALAVGVVVLSVLAASVGMVILSYATPPTKTTVPTLTSAPALPQIIFTTTPTSTPVSVSTTTATTAASSTPSIPTFTLHENAFCRKGPDISFPDVTAIPKGDIVEIQGVSQDGFWYFVFWRQFNVKCWVAAATGQTNGNSQGVPVLASPNTPTPKPTIVHLPTQPPSTPTLLP